MVLYLGGPLASPRLTTIELVPSVIYFRDNEDPFGASRLEQDPLYKLEAHLTHNFNQALWASIDGFYQGGGETTTDGISDDNSQRSINLGASVGLNLSRTWSVQFSYGQTVSDSRDGLDGEMYRLKFLTYF